MKKILFLISVLLILSSCAKQPQLTRKEWIETTTRQYKGVTKDQALEAAEKLFILADGDDFKIVHSQEGMTATRTWMMYLVIAVSAGTDYWGVKATESDGVTTVTVQANTQAQAVTPMATSGGDVSAVTMPLSGTPVMGTSLYDLFWARMDYLLGKRTDWMTCSDAANKRRQGTTWGLDEPLCNSLTVADNKP